MNEVLKQRLVGALILIALAVVFWPIIFVEPGDPTTQEIGQIPARPAVNTDPIPAPETKGLRQSPVLKAREEAEQKEITQQQTEVDVADAALEPVIRTLPATIPAQTKESEAPVVKEPKTRTEAPKKPNLDSQGVPVAWILQVASLSMSEKAEAMRSRLLEMGHKAYVKKIYRAGKPLSRVYIGPKFERAKLDKIKAGVDAEFRVQSVVVRYIP